MLRRDFMKRTAAGAAAFGGVSMFEHVLPVEGVFIYLQGAKPITDYVLGQVESTEEGCLAVDHELETTMPGVFAVGDLVCSHIKQAVIAASDGVIAAMAADKYINGREKYRADWK